MPQGNVSTRSGFKGLLMLAVLAMSNAADPQAAPLAAPLSKDATPLGMATELRRVPAEEAHQGVASDSQFVYAIGDHKIGKYSKATGRRVAQWQGEPPAFIHINSCIVRSDELVCAMSNYPGLPMSSSVERFDTRTLRHTGSHSFGPGRGSLTWIDWHNDSWWACFANYDGKGGDPTRDHRSTVLIRFTPAFTEQESWLFPDYVLDRFGHMSASGGRWGRDGLLYVNGHDLPEMYALRLPTSGARLEYLGTIATPTGGQAFDWDYSHPNLTWSVDRAGSALVESELPKPVAAGRASTVK